MVGWNSGLDKRLLGGTCPGRPETAQREGNMAGYSLQGQCVQCSAPENCAPDAFPTVFVLEKPCTVPVCFLLAMPLAPVAELAV